MRKKIHTKKPKLQKSIPKIEYPPVPTRTWVPPEERQKPSKPEPKYIKPEGISQKLAISTLKKCWNLFEISGEAAIMLGHFSQKHKRFGFKSNDLQGACISALACVYQNLFRMETWDPYQLDEIIVQGDKLYLKSIMQGDKCLVLVSPEKMCKVFWLDSYKITVQVDQNGKVKHRLTASSEEKLKTIMEEALQEFLKSYESFIFSIKEKYAAIWIQDGAYYLFDPGEHDSLGNPYVGAPGYGFSLLARFKKLRSLVECIFKNFPSALTQNSEFELIGCSISRMVNIQVCPPPDTLEDIKPQEVALKFAEEPVPPPDTKLEALKSYIILDQIEPDPVKNMAAEMSPFVSDEIFSKGELAKPSFLPEDEPFERLDEGRYAVPIPSYIKRDMTKLSYYIEIEPNEQGILRAHTSQNDPNFSKYEGRQSLGNALSALLMLRVQKSKYWIPSYIDFILQQGDILFQEAMRSISRTKTLRLTDFPKKIEYKDQLFQPEITEYALVGQLNSQDLEVLDLTPALDFFLSEHDCCIILGPIVLAVWAEDGVYFMFDPNDRDQKGKAITKLNPNVLLSEETQNGVACVSWFKNLKNLVELYMQNVEKSRRDERFYLSRVKIKDYCEVSEDWNNFKGFCWGKWILRGTISQESYRFSQESRHFQGAANALTSLAMASLIGLQDWNSDTIDEVLITGDQLYQTSVRELNEKSRFISPMLMLSEVKKTEPLKDKKASFEVEECTVNGLIFAKENNDLPCLYKGLEKFFRDNDMGILTSREISIAFWKIDDYYYYFDPYSRDAKGLPTGFGTSCVIRTVSLEDMSKYLEFNLDPKTEDTYNISNVKVTLYEGGAGPVKPPLNHFTKIGENLAILRSELSEKSEVFEIYTQGKQTIPMCLIATAFNKLKPSREWTKNDIDDILSKGDALYIESMTELQKQSLQEALEKLNDVEVPIEESVSKDIRGGGDAGSKIAENSPLPEEEKEPQEVKETDENEEIDIEPKITLENVKNSFSIGPNSFEVEVLGNDVVTWTPGQTLQAMKDALETRFDVPQNEDNPNSEYLLASEEYSVALWRDDKSIYLFDSKPRNQEGKWIGNEDWEPEEIPEVVVDDNKEIKEGDEDLEADEEGDVGDTQDIDEDVEDVKTDEGEKINEMGEESPEILPPEAMENIPENDDGDQQEVLDADKEEMQEKPEENEPEQKVDVPKIKRSKTYWNEQEKNGRACVLRFLTVEDMTEYIYNNFPPEDRAKGVFAISELNIKNALKLKSKWNPEYQMTSVYDGDWYDFKEVDSGMWIIRATGDLTSPIFPEKNRGRQTLTASVIALAVKHVFDLTCFVSTTPDTMLMYGDKLYSYLRKLRTRQLTQDPASNVGKEEIDTILDYYDFTLEDIPKRICLSLFMVDINIEPNVISGDIKAQDFEEVLDVKRGLEMFFEHSKYGILQSKGLYVAVWSGMKTYYMFDGMKRGPNGIQSSIGVACITRFLNLEKLAQVFCANLPKIGSNEFLIHKVILSRDLCPREREAKEVVPVPKTVPTIPVLKTVIPGKFIVRGSISQEDPKFGNKAGLISTPTAIAALTMTLIHNPEIWTRPFLDDIVELGAELYEESVNQLGFDFNPWEDTMDIYRVKNEFKVGVLKANFEIRHTDQKGILDSKDPMVNNLRRGIESFFQENSHGVLVTDPLTLAIWEQPHQNDEPLIYMFDPNPRGTTGMPLFSGTACLLSFVNAKLASDHIIGCILNPDKKSCEFTIFPVEIVVEDCMRTPHKLRKITTKSSIQAVVPRCSKLVASEQKRILRKLAQEQHKRKEQKRLDLIGRQGYHSIKGDQAILRGYKSQESYPTETKNKQDIPNCIVAVVLHSISSIDKWNHRYIDLVLDAGNQLYIDSYIAYGPSDPKLGMENIMRKFVIEGEIEVHVTIYKPIITERFTPSKISEVLEVFFQQEPVCLLQHKDMWLAVFFKTGYYYLFDPHSRDINGDPLKPCGEKLGTAVVLRFEKLNSLVFKIFQNLSETVSISSPSEESLRDADKDMFSLWLMAIETK